MSRNREFGLSRGIAAVITGGLAVASLYGMVHEWPRLEGAIFFGSAAFITGGLSLLIATKVDEVNFNSALKHLPPRWPGL